MINIFQFVFDFMDKIVGLFDVLYNFLFTEIPIATSGFGLFGWVLQAVGLASGQVITISLWGLLGGAGLVTILILSILKKVVPLL